MYDIVISGLVRRRRELTGDIMVLLAQIDALAADVDALDKVLRQFDPDILIDAIPALQRRPKPDWAIRGEVVRIIFDMLREAGEPMTTHAITTETHRRRGIDGEITRAHLKRIHKCLDRQRARGAIASVQVQGLLCWRLA
jgi:hypothetical protein